MTRIPLLKTIALCATACALLASCQPSAKDGIKLAANGQPLLKVAVNSEDITPEEKKAADDLADYLGRVAGAKFEVVEEKSLAAGEPAIFVGRTDFAKRSGLDPAAMEQQDGRIQTRDGSLIITGGRPHGTEFATYFFLEKQIGCRWYSIWDEKIPSKPDLALGPLDIVYNPAFKIPYIYAANGSMKGPYGNYKDFEVRNRSHRETVGVPPGANVVHTFSIYFNPRDYPDHPEYASFINGKYSLEIADQFNLLNPEVRAIVLERLKKVIRANPNVDYYDVSQNDGNQGRDQSPAALEMEAREGKSGQFIDFINYLADGIKDEFPKAQLRTFAYNVTGEAPKTLKVRPNVTIFKCLNAFHPYLPMEDPENLATRRELEDWGKAASKMMIWEYDIYDPNITGLPMPAFDSYATRYKFYRSINVESLFCESEYIVKPVQLLEMKHWVIQHLMEDPDADVWALVRDFSDGVYGPAGKFIYDYVKLLESRKRDYMIQLYDTAFLSEGDRLLIEAEAAVGGKGPYFDRVRDVRWHHDMATLLYWNKNLAEWARSGKNPAEFPFDKEKIIARAEPHLDLLFEQKRWLVEREWLEGYKTLLVEPIIRSARASTGPLPLPEELKGVAPERIVELPVPIIGMGTGLGNNYWAGYRDTLEDLPQNDPDAPGGVGIFLKNEPSKHDKSALPFHFTGRNIERGAIKGAGYHLYKMGRYNLNELPYFYWTGSTRFQVRPLISLLDPKKDKNLYTAYVSIKTQGPDLPFGDKTKPNGVWFDRVILVKDEPPAPPKP